MSRLREVVVQLARTPQVRRARRLAGRFGAPGLNPEFEHIRRVELDVHSRLDSLELTVRQLERHLPLVVNAIDSANGTARLLRRELDERFDSLAARVDRLSEDVGRVVEPMGDESTV